VLTDVKKWVNNQLSQRGLRIEYVGKADSLVGTPRRSLAESYSLLAKLNLAPKTVIDVGAAFGTPDLHNAFPNAELVLFEPVAEFEPSLNKILETRRGVLVGSAAGKTAGTLTFYVHTNQLEGSSAYQETQGEYADGEQRTVQVVRVDETVNELGLAGPYILKIDVQGGELDVLAGCSAILDQVVAISLEVSLFQFMSGAPQCVEVVDHLAKLGFVPWDVIPGWTRPLDQALGQLDIVFVPENGPLRENHSFATQAQYDKLH